MLLLKLGPNNRPIQNKGILLEVPLFFMIGAFKKFTITKTFENCQQL